MSVEKSKRSESKMEVMLAAGQLAEYTIKICANEKNFPKRYRWCITNKIVEAVVAINEQVNEANAVYVKYKDDYLARRNRQNAALTKTYALLADIDLAHRVFGIESKRLEHWVGLVLHEQALIRRWRKADDERYGKIMG